MGLQIHTKRDELLDGYRRAEATERETMDKLAKRVKTIARRVSPLGADPCAVQKETLAQLGLFATDLHLEELDAAEEACVAPADEDEDKGAALDAAFEDAFEVVVDETLDAIEAGALAVDDEVALEEAEEAALVAVFGYPSTFDEEEAFAARFD